MGHSATYHNDIKFEKKIEQKYFEFFYWVHIRRLPD